MDNAETKTDAARKKGFFSSEAFGWALKSIVCIIAVLLIFQLGMYVGFRKASYSFGWGDNYSRVFGGPRSGLLRDFSGRDFLNGHGLAGSVVSVDDPNIVIIGSDGVEKTVETTDRTAIVRGRQPIDLSGLFPDDTVTIVGRPENDGIIFADMIRVLDFNHNDNAPLPPR